MEIERTYPSLKKQTYRVKVRDICFWIFILAAYACPIINLCVGGKCWSVVVLWSLWFAWTAFFSRPLVEYHLIGRITRLCLNSCILLILIDVFLRSGWAAFVIPLVCFGLLIVLGIIFLRDITRQKQNMMPMLWVIGGSLAAIPAAILGLGSLSWPMIVLGSTAFALLAASTYLLRRQLLTELKKRFHI